MDPNTTETTAQTAETAGTSAGGTTGGATGTAQTTTGTETTTERAFSQAQVNALIGARLKEARTGWENDAKATAEREQAVKSGEWEKVAKGHEERAIKAEARAAELERAALVASVAAKHKLPPALASRLSGATEAELDADAKELAKLISPPKAPATEAGAGTRGTTDTGTTATPPAATPMAKDAPRYAFQSERDVAWPA